MLTATFYNRMDRKGRPIVNRDCILRFASTEHSDKFIPEVNAIMAKTACAGVGRVQFASDGAAWLETLFVRRGEAPDETAGRRNGSQGA